MPRYLKDRDYMGKMSHPLGFIESILDKAGTLEDRAYISLLYLTGARPVEMGLLSKNSVKVVGEDILITIDTAKRGFRRTLRFGNKTPLLHGHILPFWATLNDGDIAFKKDITTYKKIIYRLSENMLTPYTFRHHRMTRMAELGANAHELKYWKGARSTKSVEPYLHFSGLMNEKFKDKIL